MNTLSALCIIYQQLLFAALVLTDVKDCSLLVPCVWPCPQPDPEELCAFTELYGSLKLLLSFQVHLIDLMLTTHKYK